jgi:hypothetical protein
VSSSERDILQNTNSKEEETAILFSDAVFFSVMSVFLFFMLLHFPRSSAMDKSLPYKISQLIAASPVLHGGGKEAEIFWGKVFIGHFQKVSSPE